MGKQRKILSSLVGAQGNSMGTNRPDKTAVKMFAKRYGISQIAAKNVLKAAFRKKAAEREAIVFRKGSVKKYPFFPLKGSPITKMIARKNRRLQGLSVLKHRVNDIINVIMKLDGVSKRKAIEYLWKKNPPARISVILTDGRPEKGKSREIILFYDLSKKKIFFKTNFEIDLSKPMDPKDQGLFAMPTTHAQQGHAK